MPFNTNVLRRVLFAGLIIDSLVVIGIASYFTYLTNTENYYFEAFAFGIATGVITLLCVGATRIIGALRRGAFTSMVWVEIAWIGVLWVLWVAAAGSITNVLPTSVCLDYGYYSTSGADASLCQLYQATEAFSWLAWLKTFGWFWTLLICSIVAHSRGHADVWYLPVTEHAIFTRPSGKGEALAGQPSYGMATQPPTSYNSSPAFGNSAAGSNAYYNNQNNGQLNYGNVPQSAAGSPYPQNTAASVNAAAFPQHPSYPQV